MAVNDKVMFKLGTQASVNEILAGTKQFQVGTFYLTSDSDRLYVGQQGGLKLLNKSVRVVADEAEMKAMTTKHADDFVYLSKENILAVYNGSSWVQINPDTNTIITAITKTIGTVDDGVKVTEKADTKTGEATGSVTANEINITGEKGAQVTANGTTGIKITGDTYTLSSTAPDKGSVDVNLKSALGQGSSQIKIHAGGNITLSGNANDFTIAAEDTKLESVTAACPADGNGNLSITVKDTAGTTKTGAVQLGYKIDGINYYINDPDELPIYTKDQVDNKFNLLNPMRYMGTIGSAGTYDLNSSYKVVDTSLNAVNVSVGDMFLVSGTVTYAAEKEAKQGDLLIAQGTETKGVITADLRWEYVPSGDDTITDTSYLFKVDTGTNKISVIAQANGTAGATVGVIQLVEGTAVDLKTETNSTTANQMITTISHSDINCTTTEDEALQLSTAAPDFTVINGITVNEQGHVTGIVSQDITTNTYKPGPDSVSEVTNGVKVNHTLYENGNTLITNPDAYSQIMSSSLEIKKGTNNTDVSIDLVWGSF